MLLVVLMDPLHYKRTFIGYSLESIRDYVKLLLNKTLSALMRINIYGHKVSFVINFESFITLIWDVYKV